MLRDTLKIWTSLLVTGMLLLSSTPIVNAQSIPTADAATETTTITLTDLTNNLGYIFPNASYLSGLEYHSTWREVGRKNMTETSGIEVTYEAVFDEVPDQNDELPTFNAYIIPTNSLEDAQTQLETWSNSYQFDYGLWEKLTEGSNYFTYYTDSSSNNDLVKYRALEEASLHLATYHDNVMIVVNFYRPAGEYLSGNVSAYLEYLDNYEETLSVMNELVIYIEEALIYYTGSKYSTIGPEDYDYYPLTAEYYANLSDSMSISRNGTLDFDLYIDDGSETGTIFNMSGIAMPSAGDFVVSLNENAAIEVSFYAPDTDSSCKDGSGWHHLYTDSIGLYEWQSLTLHYGQREGLKIDINEVEQDSCEVYNTRANHPIYLGDYPSDSIAESFIGYLKNINSLYSVNDEGQVLDMLEDTLIFSDVSEAHRYADSIAYMKDNGIIEGYSDGTFKPEGSVNRVEILKMLLLGFDYTVPEDYFDELYSDLVEGAWYLPYVNYATQLGIVSGHDNGTYLPSHPLNRVELLKILLNAYNVDVSDYPAGNLYADTDSSAWYAPYVQYSKDNGLMDTDSNGNFNPANNVSRGEVAETIYRLIQG